MIKNGKYAYYKGNEYKFSRDADGYYIIITSDLKKTDCTFKDKYNTGVYKKYVKDTGDKIPAVIASTASPYKFTRSVMDAIDPAYDAEDDFESVLQREKHFLHQNLRSLVVVLAAFRVSEDDILCSGALYHFGRHLSRVCAFLLVGAVFCSKSDDVLVEYLCHRGEMYERSAYNHTAVRLFSVECFVEHFCQSYTFLQVLVHFPVACYNIHSLFFVFKEFV